MPRSPRAVAEQPGALVGSVPTRRPIWPGPSASRRTGEAHRHRARASTPSRRRPRRELLAVNMVVVGTPPDRAAAGSPAHADLRVEVDGRAGPRRSGHHGRGRQRPVPAGPDVVPRGHPGDGRAEVQVYALPRGRAGAGCATGSPRVPTSRTPASPSAPDGAVDVSPAATAGSPLEVDGVAGPAADRVTVDVVPGAFRSRSELTLTVSAGHAVRSPARTVLRHVGASTIGCPCCTRRSTSPTTRQRRPPPVLHEPRPARSSRS